MNSSLPATGPGGGSFSDRHRCVMRVELGQRIVNLLPLPFRPTILGNVRRRLYCVPTTERASGENQTPPAACPADDPSSRSVERRGATWSGYLAAMDAAVESGRETQRGQHTNLQRQQSLFDGYALVEGSQEANGSLEHGWLRLVIGHPFAYERQRRSCGANRAQAAKDSRERAVHRHAVQVRELATTRTEARIHQDVGL